MRLLKGLLIMLVLLNTKQMFAKTLFVAVLEFEQKYIFYNLCFANFSLFQRNSVIALVLVLCALNLFPAPISLKLDCSSYSNMSGPNKQFHVLKVSSLLNNAASSGSSN